MEKFKPMNLANATPEFLSDELGEIREVLKEGKKQEGFIKAALKARMDEGMDLVEGDYFRTTIDESVRNGLDTPKIKASMSQEWIDEHSKTTEVTTVRSKRLRDKDDV